jgi:hypothetical protein
MFYYQLALVTPRSLPSSASSRNAMRDNMNFLRIARGRPVMAQRLRTRIGLESRGSEAKACCAAIFSASLYFGDRIVSLRTARRSR